MSAYTLHLGVRPHLAADLAARLDLAPDALGAQPRVYLDNDWEEWGERPEDVERPEGWAAHPDAVTPAVHLAIEVSDLAHAYAVLAGLARDGLTRHLVPMRYPYQAGTIATITTADDWSEGIAVIHAGRHWTAATEEATR